KANWYVASTSASRSLRSRSRTASHGGVAPGGSAGATSTSLLAGTGSWRWGSWGAAEGTWVPEKATVGASPGRGRSSPSRAARARPAAAPRRQAQLVVTDRGRLLVAVRGDVGDAVGHPTPPRRCDGSAWLR